MLVNDIPKDKIRACIENLHSLFDPFANQDVIIMKKALALYRNGAIYNVIVQGDKIHASAIDNGDTYKVELEVDFLEISLCTCDQSEEMFCVHKLATLFYIFSLFDSPGEFFNQWKDGYKLTTSEKKQPIPKETIFIDPKKRPYDEDSLQSWLSFFNEQYEKFRKKQVQRMSIYWSYTRTNNLTETIVEDYYPALLDAPKPSSPMGEILFHLHAALTAVEKILEDPGDSNVTMYSHNHTGKYLSALISDIAEYAHSIYTSKFPFTKADEKIISDTPERMMNLLLLTRDYQYDRFYLFQVVCANVFNQKNFIDKLKQKFQARLQKEEKLKNTGKVNFSSECRLVLAHFDFMKEKDQEAIKKVAEGPASEVFYCTTWVKALAQNKLWKRFAIWLPFIEEKMSQFVHQYGDQQLKRDLVNFYLFFIREYAREKGTESIYINTLQTWLPYSYHDFCEYLLEKKEFRKWTELQLFAEVSIENIDRGVLKEVEQQDRSCLLPLYHNACEQLIALKNRDAYKQAVKYLRKLKTHYRALKKEPVWDNYITMLSTKYKRLRAFQEELRKGKGKLIND